MTACQCLVCKHYRGQKKCRAYPDGIPSPLLYNKALHTEPYEGDNGIQYEPVDASEEAQP